MEWQIPARWLVSARGVLIPFQPQISCYSEGASWSSGIDRGGLIDVLGPSLGGLLGGLLGGNSGGGDLGLDDVLGFAKKLF